MSERKTYSMGLVRPTRYIISRGLSEHASSGGARPYYGAMGPSTWAALAHDFAWAGPGDQGVIFVFGVPIVQDPSVVEGTADFRASDGGFIIDQMTW
jgi:hypothetical protein